MNYNDSKTTIELLERIKKYEVLNRIVIVDNNSTDNSYELLKKYENEKIKIIKTLENKGYGFGNNIGAKKLADEDVDYIIISNPDIIFKEKDIYELCNSFDGNNNIAIVAPTINEHGNLSRGWKFSGPILDSFCNINYIGRYFKKKQLYKEEYYQGKYSKVDIVSGCFFIIRKDVFEKIGYFDENTFLYYEENILAKKIRNIGMDIIVRNDVEIIHNHSVSINKSYNKIKKFKILTKSQRYYHRKYNNAGIFKMFVLDTSYIVTLAISYLLKIFQR